MGGSVRRRGVVGLLLPGLLAACGGGPTESGGVDVAALRAAVTPELAATIRADGTIPVGGPLSPGGLPIMPEAQATAVAEFWARNRARNVASDLVTDRDGLPIDFASVRRCAPPALAQSPVADLPADLPNSMLDVLGASWIFLFCDREGAAFALSVAAHYLDLRVSSDGSRIEFPPPYAGGWIGWMGVPRSQNTASLMSAEEAVLRVHEQTGARISSPPVLVTVPFVTAMQAVWLVQLDAEVPAVVRQAPQRPERILFWGNLGRLSDGARLYAGSSDGREIDFEDSARRRFVLRMAPAMSLVLAPAIVLRGR